MLTYQDCCDMSGIDEDIIQAIAEHEHLTAIVAAELGCCLVHSRAGIRQLRRFIIDDLRHAQFRADQHREQNLRSALQQFLADYQLH